MTAWDWRRALERLRGTLTDTNFPARAAPGLIEVVAVGGGAVRPEDAAPYQPRFGFRASAQSSTEENEAERP